jgi:lysozyme
MNKLGVDVSHWQTTMNWDRTKAAGVEFAFIKATQGADILDAFYKLNWMESKRVGIPRGPYHFYDYRVDPIRQAQWLLGNTQLDPGELGYVVDVEKLKVNGVTIKVPPTYGNDIRRFCEFIEKETDIQTIIYTAYAWWTDNKLSTATWARKYRLWIANYNNVYPMTPLPWGADGWTFWQFSCKGDGKTYGTDGITSKQIDLNTWRQA